MKKPPKKRVHVQIVEYIKQQIEEGALSPGDRLPSERALAEQLEVSRTSIKEAFVVMQSEGLIEVKHGSGARLLKDNTEDIMIKMNLIINQTTLNIVELMELRQAVEGEAASLAAIRSSKDDLAKIKTALENLEKAVLNKELAAEEDLQFHVSIAKASRNLLFVEVMYLLSQRMLTALATSREETQKKPGKSLMIYEEHITIFEAIADGDAALAREAMNNHLSNVKRRYL